jgi:hypothetical protein
MLASFTGQPVQHRRYSKPTTKVNANAWVWNIDNGNRGRTGGSANSDAETREERNVQNKNRCCTPNVSTNNYCNHPKIKFVIFKKRVCF